MPFVVRFKNFGIQIIEMENQEADSFRKFLKSSSMSSETIEKYMLYYNKFIYLINTAGFVNQSIVYDFIGIYPHDTAKATLKNYFEFKGWDYKLPKIKGKPPKKVTKTLSPREIEEVRANLYNQKIMYGLIFDLTLSCALRRQEVLNIKLKDIEIEKDEEGREVMKIKLTKAKGRKQRWVVVNQQLARHLIEWIYGENDFTIDSYIFPSPVKENTPIFKTTWNSVFAKASGKEFHPHLLRHQKSLEWFEKGIDIVRIQQRLGHSTISTTRKYINPDAKRELQRWSEEG
jgi:integrase